MIYQQFHLDNPDRNLVKVVRPEEVGGPLPVVICSHGWRGRSSDREALQRLDYLNVPMAVVAFDYFGCGETGGDWTDMSYGRWTDNLEAVFDWVLAQDWADKGRVGLDGHSSGTTSALRLAARRPDVAFVISKASALGLFISFPNVPGRILAENFETLAAGGTAEIFGHPMKLAFYLDFLSRAPLYFLEQVNCPVLLLQGKDDGLSRRSDAWMAHEGLRKAGKVSELIEFEGVGHGFGNVPDIHRIAIDWLGRVGILPA